MGTDENLKQREAMTHELKIWPEHIEDLDWKRKTFEIRSIKDRDFRVGDTLLLNEYRPGTRIYTGRQLIAEVVGVHTCCGVADGYAILSLAGIERRGRQWIEQGAMVNKATDHPEDRIMDGHPRLPGAEGLAEKVKEISGWAPPPEITDPVAIRFGRDAKYVASSDGNGRFDAVWVSRKTILEQLGIREIVPWTKVLQDGEEKIGLWKTFDSAPKDGSIFLAFHDTWKVPVAIQWAPHVSQTGNYWITGTKDQTWPSAVFSGWMPMPEAFKPFLKDSP